MLYTHERGMPSLAATASSRSRSAGVTLMRGVCFLVLRWRAVLCPDGSRRVERAGLPVIGGYVGFEAMGSVIMWL